MYINAIIKSFRQRVAKRNCRRKKRNITTNFSHPFSICFPKPNRKLKEKPTQSPQSYSAPTQPLNFPIPFSAALQQRISASALFQLIFQLNSKDHRLIIQMVSHIRCSRVLPTQQSFVIITLLLSSSPSLCSTNRSLIKARQVCLIIIVIITWFQVLPA